MREHSGDLFTYGRMCNALVLTTNGTVKNDGKAVMGRGVARYARDNFKGVDRRLGSKIRKNGNKVQIIGKRVNYTRSYYVVAFPVKNMWHENAILELIVKSARSLVVMADKHGWRKVALPRPGCGNGNLKWADVKKAIAPILDDRFVVVNNEDEDAKKES